MPTREYIQFYLLNDNDDNINFSNGFSSTWNIVNPKWVGLIDETVESEKFGNIVVRPGVLYKDLKVPALPVVADEVWVSILFISQWAVVRQWVHDHRDIKFVIGGPAVLSRPVDRALYTSIPNAEFKLTTVEQELGVEPSSDYWNMKYPDGLGSGERVYAISNGMGCWWNRCKFCNSYKVPHTYVPLEPTITYRAPDGIIWLGSDSLRLTDIPALERIKYEGDRSYSAYVCGTSRECDAFEELFRKVEDRARKLKVRIGLEIPSNRTRRIFGKPGSLESVSRMVNIFNRYGAKVAFHIMYAIPNLTDEDISDIKWFIDSIKGCNNITGFGARPLELMGNDLFPGIETRDKIYSKHARTRIANLNREDIDKNTEYLRLVADFVNDHPGARLVFRKEDGPSDEIIENLI